MTRGREEEEHLFKGREILKGNGKRKKTGRGKEGEGRTRRLE